jgi:hypothetical protein
LREALVETAAARAAWAARLRRLARRVVGFRDLVGRNMATPLTDWSVIIYNEGMVAASAKISIKISAG